MQADQEPVSLPRIDIQALPGNFIYENSSYIHCISLYPVVRPRDREAPTQQPYCCYPDNFAISAELNRNIGFGKGLGMCISRYMHGSLVPHVV